MAYVIPQNNQIAVIVQDSIIDIKAMRIFKRHDIPSFIRITNEEVHVGSGYGDDIPALFINPKATDTGRRIKRLGEAASRNRREQRAEKQTNRHHFPFGTIKRLKEP